MKNCPICENDDTILVSDKKYSSPYLYEGKEISLLFDQCKTCGFSFLENPIDQNELSRYYENLGHLQGLNNDKLIDIQNQFITNSLTKKITNVLDVGCSDGYFLMSFDDSIDKYGNDVRKESEDLEKAGIGYIPGYFEETSFDKKYDLIALRHVLEHFVDINRSLRKVNEVISSDGFIYIEVPDIYYLKDVQTSNSGYYFEHISYFSIVTLTNFLSKHHFKIVNICQEVNPKDSLQAYGVLRVLAQKDESMKLFDENLMSDYVLSNTIINIHLDRVRGINESFKEKFISNMKDKKVAVFGAGANTVELMNFVDDDIRESVVAYRKSVV